MARGAKRPDPSHPRLGTIAMADQALVEELVTSLRDLRGEMVAVRARLDKSGNGNGQSTFWRVLSGALFGALVAAATFYFALGRETVSRGDIQSMIDRTDRPILVDHDRLMSMFDTFDERLRHVERQHP